MGYELSELEADLAQVPRRWRGTLRDAAQLAYGWAFERAKHLALRTPTPR
jgi:hypothetical protein